MMADITQYDDEKKTKTMTTKQADNWVSQAEVRGTFNLLEKDVKPLWTKPKRTKNDMKNLMSYIALALYVLIPPRRITDYCLFKVRHVDRKVDNFMQGYTFVFNQYKTAKRYGTQTVPIPPKLHTIILRWSKLHHNDYLLFNSAGKPLHPSKLTRLLNQVFGRAMSANMLRHMYTSQT